MFSSLAPRRHCESLGSSTLSHITTPLTNYVCNESIYGIRPVAAQRALLRAVSLVLGLLQDGSAAHSCHNARKRDHRSPYRDIAISRDLRVVMLLLVSETCQPGNID